MNTILTVASLVVLILIVAAASRRVRTTTREIAGANILPAFVISYLIIFAIVSLSAASQLLEGSAAAKFVLFTLMVVNAAVAIASWRGTETQ